MSHPDLTDARVDALRDALAVLDVSDPGGPPGAAWLLEGPVALRADAGGGDAGAPAPATAPPVTPPAPVLTPTVEAPTPAGAARVKARAKRAVRTLGSRVAGRILERAAASMAARVVRRFDDRLAVAYQEWFPPLIERLDGLDRRADAGEARVEAAMAGIAAVAPAIDAVTAAQAAAALATGRGALEDLQVLGINFELLKAEVYANQTTVGDQLAVLEGAVGGQQETLDRMGRAVAPDAGLGAAPDRLADWRARINRIERTLAAGPAVAPGSTPPPVVPTPADAPAGEETTSESAPTPSRPPATPEPAPLLAGDDFDYVGCERRFRGDPAAILATLSERYLDILRGHQPVLDIGCGRGELLAVLRDAGVTAGGVDLDAGMVAEAQAQGLDAVHGDALAHLRSLPPASLGAITAIHVIEHLAFADLRAFVDLAASRLAPGGVLIAETPNPTSLIVLGTSFILDPTHVWPIHPSMAAYLCERAGFADVRLAYWSPAEFYRLPLVDAGEDAPPWIATVNEAFTRLNDVLFGPQDYAVIAAMPAE